MIIKETILKNGTIINTQFHEHGASHIPGQFLVAVGLTGQGMQSAGFYTTKKEAMDKHRRLIVLYDPEFCWPHEAANKALLIEHDPDCCVFVDYMPNSTSFYNKIFICSKIKQGFALTWVGDQHKYTCIYGFNDPELINDHYMKICQNVIWDFLKLELELPEETSKVSKPLTLDDYSIQALSRRVLK